MEKFLIPWVEWLNKNGQRPTTQRILEYLETREGLTTKGSYKKIGFVIVAFTNRYLPSGERVELIPPLGFAKEKATLAMPRYMLDALTADVKKRVHTFEPGGENYHDPDASMKLAKYLGK